MAKTARSRELIAAVVRWGLLCDEGNLEGSEQSELPSGMGFSRRRRAHLVPLHRQPRYASRREKRERVTECEENAIGDRRIARKTRLQTRSRMRKRDT
jgi:hypothetical protein